MPTEGLYHPCIEVPTEDWFMRALLYWDAIGSIIPKGLEKDRQLSRRMRALIDARLVRAVQPESYVWRIPRFDEDFLAFLDRDPRFGRQAASSLDRSLTVQVHSAKLKMPSEIHQEKFSDGLMTELCRRGLARRGRGPWVSVEQTTAELFMAYLAARLCELDELAKDPVTGKAAALTPFAMQIPGVVEFADREILEIVLPAPAADTSPKSLAAFKERHHDELRAFRHHLETAMLDIAIIEDKDVRRKRLALLKDGLAIQLDELNARRRERGWRSGVVVTLLQVLSPAGALAVAVCTGHPLIAAGGLPGLLLAGYLAARRDTVGLRGSPLAYAVRARRELAG